MDLRITCTPRYWTFFNPKQARVFQSSKSSQDMLLPSYIAVFQSNHYFMVSNENLGLQWSIEAIIMSFFYVEYFCRETAQK